MANSKFEIEKFNGASDFSLWKIRMMAHLGILGLKNIISDFSLKKEVSVTVTKGEDKKPGSEGEAAESGSLTKTVLDPIKVEQSEQAKNLIILHVGDSVLRKINHCETAAQMWNTLNQLYMETSLPNRVYLQLKFYSFKMSETKSINDNVDDFLKLVAELGSLGIVVTEEVQAILILNSLPLSYDQLKHTLKYGNKTLSVQDVVFHEPWHTI